MKKEILKYAGAIAVCLSVVGIVSASSTISTNITTGGTLNVTGATTLSSTLGVTGLSTFTYASTTGGITTEYASTTKLIVGGAGTAVSGVVMGTCTIPATTITASTTKNADCTATGVAQGDQVFVTATSSVGDNFVITAASSSATNKINIRFYNSGQTSATVVGPTSLYFWASR